MADPRINILEMVAKATEIHRDDLVLCGGMAAFLICREANSVADAAMTEDVDLTVERKASRQKTLKNLRAATLATGLAVAGFEREITTLPVGDDTATEKWVRDGDSFYVEFLTDDHRQKVHSISGINALGLSYFSMSLDNTFLHKLPSGREIRVVTPEAFVMHKLLTFPRRMTDGKRMKDLYYVAFLERAVFASPEVLAAGLASLKIAPAWTKTASNNINTIVKNLAVWASRIRDNDPTGILTDTGVSDMYTQLAMLYKPAS